MIKIEKKGKILEGPHSTQGEIMIEHNEDNSRYYIYIWPNNGKKFLGPTKQQYMMILIIPMV